MQGLDDITCFKVTLAEHIATVTIDRPPVNAQNRLFRDEIARIFDVLHDTDACRAIILTGAGRAFSAGADLKERPNVAGNPGAYPAHNRSVRNAFGLAGGVRHVRRHFGESDARLMLLTARRISGRELLRMNGVSACVPQAELLPMAMEIARDITQKVPLAVRAAKRSFNVTETMPLTDGYKFEQSQTVALSATEDTREAWAAFAEKRKPVFKGR